MNIKEVCKNCGDRKSCDFISQVERMKFLVDEGRTGVNTANEAVVEWQKHMTKVKGCIFTPKDTPVFS